MREGIQYPQEVNLREAYEGKFVDASPAEAEGAHEVRVREFSLPVSLSFEAGRFRLNGMTGENNWGIISGTIVGDKIKINHIKIADKLKGTGMGSALLADLEGQFNQRATRTIYAAFGNRDTVNFFKKNGYAEVGLTGFSEEEKSQLDINPKDFDLKIYPEGAKLLLSKEL